MIQNPALALPRQADGGVNGQMRFSRQGGGRGVGGLLERDCQDTGEVPDLEMGG
jgi:hypothetical protein